MNSASSIRLTRRCLILVVALSGLVPLGAPRPARAQFCAETFRVDGTMTLNGGGGPGTFESTDLPQWISPYSNPVRGTGIVATSCRRDAGQPTITVQSLQPPVGWTPPGTPVHSVTVPLNDLCLAAWREQRDARGLAPRRRGLKGKSVDTKRAEQLERAMRLRCVVRPEPHQAALLDRLGLRLSERLRPLPLTAPVWCRLFHRSGHLATIRARFSLEAAEGRLARS